MPEPERQVLVYLCGHLADAMTAEPLGYLTDPTTGKRWLRPILAWCRACGPQKVERVKKGESYDQLPE